MSTLVVNLAGLLLMGAIVWWFWLSGSGASENETNDEQNSHH